MAILKELGLFETPTDKLARQSYAGMAHFAGTGPDGKYCGDCRHLDRGKGPGKLEYPCSKFKALTGKIGRSVPVSAASCRHFEAKR